MDTSSEPTAAEPGGTPNDPAAKPPIVLRRLGFADRTLTGYRATPNGLESRAA